jgi:tetratricopeptide (TPR) repeat protein
VALGDFDSAKQLFEKSLAMNDPIRRRNTAVVSMAMLGYICEHGGDQINAIKHYLEATRLARAKEISSADLCDARNAAARVVADCGEYPGAIMLVADCSVDDTAAAEIRNECYRVLRRE